MMNFLAELITVLLTPFILLAFVISLLWGLIRYPFCKAKYKKSHYFKDFGIKYAAFVYDSDFYTVYNAIKEANLPLTSVLCRDRKNRANDMLFFYGKTLFCVYSKEEIDYDADNGNWIVEIYNDRTDKDETVDIIDHINKWIDDQLIAHPDCPLPDRRVILIQPKHIAKKNRIRAMESHEFLVYDKKNIATALEKFISEQK